MAKQGTKKGYKKGDNKLKLLEFLKKEEPKTYHDIIKSTVKSNKGNK